ncbi:MBL fold metallo-hydrolase [Actinorhabdospora filicis]|uniref:MBL fold metallo-hydrolase n=1 Tax=Actinorhabdospora filicis TaxID=1785913 RepID=A0A9W6SFQ7_9ACTN|nr:MBL fold metallo-hydrolase [Actinorhabdospora filicis]GLZ75483.1 MBL fold metallo-hydrolase [Actinorhabdospora filicis]
MLLTKYTHAAVRVEEGGRAIFVDPGIWTEPGALDGAEAILISHVHNDHMSAELIAEAAGKNPDLRVYGPAEALAHLDLGERAVAVEAGESFEAAGMTVSAHGGRHAHIWEELPDVANLGYLVGGRVYVPGDSLVPPGVDVEVLFVPIHGSWMKIGEAIAFAREVKPERAHPIHDAQMSPERGWHSADAWLTRASETAYSRLAFGVAEDLG